MRCFLAGQSCSADRGQRIYTHITAHNSPIRKNTRFTWKIPTLRGSPSPERDPVSVGFLHTPNFAAFWPKTRKKGFWDNVLVSCKQFSTSPPPCRCQAPVQNRKKHREIKRFCPKPIKPREIEKKPKNQRFWDNVLVSCKHSVGQIVFFGFFSISRGFLRFWTKSFDFSMFF